MDLRTRIYGRPCSALSSIDEKILAEQELEEELADLDNLRDELDAANEELSELRAKLEQRDQDLVRLKVAADDAKRKLAALRHALNDAGPTCDAVSDLVELAERIADPDEDR